MTSRFRLVLLLFALWLLCPRGPAGLEAQSEPATNIAVSAGASRSAIGAFPLGEQVRLAFNVAGMKPGQKDLELRLRFLDEMDQLVKEQSLKAQADAEGKWTSEIDACPPEKRDPRNGRAKRSEYRIGEQRNQGRWGSGEKRPVRQSWGSGEKRPVRQSWGSGLTPGLSLPKRSPAAPGRHCARRGLRLWPSYAAARTYR